MNELFIIKIVYIEYNTMTVFSTADIYEDFDKAFNRFMQETKGDKREAKTYKVNVKEQYGYYEKEADDVYKEVELVLKELIK